ncbi:MAG: head GIN domain-containing protein [Rubrivivax sp.]
MTYVLPRVSRLISLLLSVLVGAVVTGLSVPSAAWAAEETRTIAGFEAVALETSDRVRVELAEQASVRVSGSPRAIEAIETILETRGGVPTLVIRSKHRTWFESSPSVQIVVQGPRFQALAVAGSGQLEATLSNQPALRLSMAGSGDLRVRGVTTHLAEVNVAGSGDVRVQGAAQNLAVRVAGSGDAWLQELEAEDVRVSVAGSGDARVHARQRLRTSVAGSGNVRYSGPAKDVSHSVAGSGRAVKD